MNLTQSTVESLESLMAQFIGSVVIRHFKNMNTVKYFLKIVQL